MNKSKSSARRSINSEQRASLLTKYQQGQWTQRQFAKEHGIGLSTLTHWIRKGRRQQAKGKPAARVDFRSVPIGSVLNAPAWTLELQRPDGTILRVHNAAARELVAQLLEASR